MIIHGVTPADDVSAVSVQQVASKIGIKKIKTLQCLLRNSLKYIAYTEPYSEFEKEGHLFCPKKASYKDHKRLIMPLSTAWRLIKDAEAGKILIKAARV